MNSDNLIDLCVIDSKGKFNNMEECVASDDCLEQWRSNNNMLSKKINNNMYVLYTELPEKLLKEAKSTYTYKIDYSTELPEKLLKEAKSTDIKQNQDIEYNISELKGFISHGINDKIQVLMNILKTKKLSPQTNITNKDLSQLTIYVGEHERNRISFSVIGNHTSNFYGQNGFSFISNKLSVFKAISNTENEFFIFGDIELSNLILTLDKKLHIIIYRL
jgi:hypothetical protein